MNSTNTFKEVIFEKKGKLKKYRENRVIAPF